MRIAFVIGKFPLLSETFILNQITGLMDRGHEVTIYAGRPHPEGKVHPDVERYRLLDRVCYWPTLPSSGRLTQLRRPGGLLATRPDIGSTVRRNAPELSKWHATNSPLEGGIGLPHSAVSTVRRERWRPFLRSLGLLNSGSSIPDFSFPLRVLQAVGYGSGEYEAIIAHFGHVGLEALRLREAGALRGKLITFFHAYDMSVFLAEKGEHAYNRLFQRGDLFLPISRFWEKRLGELGCPSERTAVHRMGIDCARFKFSARAQAPDGVTRIVSAARLVEKKGIAYALLALARVVRRHPDIEYTLIGDGPLRGQLEALAGELQLGRHVRFTGWMKQDEIATELQRMHLFLAPSVTAANRDVEGVPVALLEAMAGGMPVLSTVHSGIPEAVEDGVSGYLVPERNVEALASRLCRLIETPASWPALGRAGRDKVEQEFDIERLNDRLVERLQEMRGW